MPVITDERLIFTPHSFNFQTKPLEISLAEITAIDKRNSLCTASKQALRAL